MWKSESVVIYTSIQAYVKIHLMCTSIFLRLKSVELMLLVAGIVIIHSRSSLPFKRKFNLCLMFTTIVLITKSAWLQLITACIWFIFVANIATINIFAIELSHKHSNHYNCHNMSPIRSNTSKQLNQKILCFKPSGSWKLWLHSRKDKNV